MPEALTTGIGSVNVLKMLFSSEIVTNINYILDPSAVYFASPEGDVRIAEQQNSQQVVCFFFFFLIDVSLVKLMYLSVCSVTVCFGGLISPSIRPCFSDF